MWWRSPSFILDRQQRGGGGDTRNQYDDGPSPSSMSESSALQNPNLDSISAYYQTRAAHHGVLTSDWLAQAQAISMAQGLPALPEDSPAASGAAATVGTEFSVIDEFNNWRKQPDLAEAVAATRALAAMIRSSNASTMMELEIELKRASDSLKSWDTTFISLTAGCDLFMRYVTRTSALEYEDFNSAKSRLLESVKRSLVRYRVGHVKLLLGLPKISY